MHIHDLGVPSRLPGVDRGGVLLVPYPCAVQLGVPPELFALGMAGRLFALGRAGQRFAVNGLGGVPALRRIVASTLRSHAGIFASPTDNRP
ncbi:hypothetical protein GCM10009753_15160 [Streptantibioticus ferralitis]